MRAVPGRLDGERQPVLRAISTAARTSDGVNASATTAGRGSMLPLQVARWVS